MVNPSRIIKGDGFQMLLDDHIRLAFGRIVAYRIVSTRPRLGGVIPVGEVGGYISSVSNLSDDAWVADDSVIMGENAVASGGSLLTSNSTMGDMSRIMDNAVVHSSFIYGTSGVGFSAVLLGSVLTGNSWIMGNATVRDSEISGGSLINGYATVRNSHINYTSISGDAILLDEGTNFDTYTTGIWRG